MSFSFQSLPIVSCVLVLVTTPALAFVSSDCQPYQCSVNKELRRDCSAKENSRDSCLARGCCFDNSHYDTIWCFHPLRLPQGRCPHPECQVLPEDREQCFLGRYYVGVYECFSSGCCYDMDSYGAPQCFRRKVRVIAYTGFSIFFNKITQQACDAVLPQRRRRCGGVGTTMEQCLRFRCCWVEISLADPQCFHPEIHPAVYKRRLLK